MQIGDSYTLRKAWNEKLKLNPDLISRHNHIVAEYYYKGKNEDYVCINCEEIFSREERNRMSVENNSGNFMRMRKKN